MGAWARAGVWVAVLATLGAAGEARAQVEEGRALWLAADFEGARAAFERAVADPELPPADALQAHRYLAALVFLSGDREGARVHADRAIALDRAAEPPAGASRDVQALFDAARERRAAGELPPPRFETTGEPEILTAPVPPPERDAGRDPPTERPRRTWPWLVAGGVVLATVAVVLAVTLAGDPDQARVGRVHVPELE
jgi:tetratricopeptide (TPR) repeat protein